MSKLLTLALRHARTTLLGVSVACASATAFAAVDAQAILAASDNVRNPPKPFGVTVQLIEYRNKKQTEGNTLEVYSKSDPASGQFRSLIRFVEPTRDADKLLLKNGNDLWFYDPASKASIRLSPQQRLLGQAANGDIVTVNLAKDYTATLIGEEDLVDGEKVNRRCYKLRLTERSPDVTYNQIEMWIEVGTARPVKALYYAESGRQLKTAYYRKFQSQLGAERPTEVVIIDGLDPNWVTVMRYSDFASRNVPDAWLQRDYLPRFKPE
ncbi:outer membrane lipoprotein-sorting protein [Piscinibacter koreensis]|uniref:Outer membrane lipoprotein-sorting protein n=1 Tax=Piscinibacter koreensis TaxID=2742824 RepID=A0A7Y6NS53_9BURK|nr:outer membrane lipoprotein-sorting protein [Schlegelella koreensis]NUZ08321.1 outer membrane lipoprotein-sorting protein [Schlegelella koreensis]